jgi:hypothetical protein
MMVRDLTDMGSAFYEATETLAGVKSEYSVVYSRSMCMRDNFVCEPSGKKIGGSHG